MHRKPMQYILGIGSAITVVAGFMWYVHHDFKRACARDLERKLSKYDDIKIREYSVYCDNSTFGPMISYMTAFEQAGIDVQSTTSPSLVTVKTTSRKIKAFSMEHNWVMMWGSNEPCLVPVYDS